jgi:hypothetical protein
MVQSSREIYWSAILVDFRRSGLTHVEPCRQGLDLRPSVSLCQPSSLVTEVGGVFAFRPPSNHRPKRYGLKLAENLEGPVQDIDLRLPPHVENSYPFTGRG